MNETPGSRDGTRPAVELHDLGHDFGKTTAIERLDLSIEEGGFVGIFGPDAAGKTTLLQIMAAILDPTRGSCRVLGYNSVSQSGEITSRIGYMAQGFTLYERLTVGENLRFAGEVHGVSGDHYRRRRESLLAMAELGPFTERRADRLSGGMRKKLALCTNLIHRPPILLLDEPSLGVDPYSRRELWSILHSYHDRGTTVVVSSSYLDEATQCERVLLLHHGRDIADSSPQQIRSLAKHTVFQVRVPHPEDVFQSVQSHSDVLHVSLRESALRIQTNHPQEFAGFAQRLQFPLRQIESADPTVEDAFIRLVLESETGMVPAVPGGDDGVLSPSRPGGISTDRLTRRFGSFTAVDRVSIHIQPGDVWGIVGPNGAGKTTLIKMLCGLLPPSSGDVQVAGVDVTADPRSVRSLIGYMSQTFSLYPDLTPSENLSFFARSQGLWGSPKASTLKWARSMTGLEEVAPVPVRSLSQAVKQRLALACAVLHRPSVLFLDEPTSGVDPLARQRFWQLIRLLASRGLSVLVSTHYLEEAHYCDKLGLLMQGRLISQGTVEQLRERIDADAAAGMEQIFLRYIERERNRSSGVASG